MINRTRFQEELSGARPRSLRLTAADQKKVSSKQVATKELKERKGLIKDLNSFCWILHQSYL